MFELIRKVIRFRVAQKATRGIARGVGLRTLAGVIGILGGIQALRRR